MNPLIYYAGLYAASAALLKLAGFVLFLWLARTLSVDDYANFGLLYTLQTGLATFALAGIVEAVVGLLKEHRSVEERTRLFAAANLAFILMALAAITFALIVFVTFVKQLDIGFLALSFVLASGVLWAFSSLQAQIVRLEEKHLSSLCFSFVAPFTGLIGGFVAFFLERTAHSFFGGTAVGMSLSLLGLWVYRVGCYGVDNRTVETRSILSKVGPFIVIAFLGWLSGYGNNYVVNQFGELTEVARYTFAFTLSSIMQLIASALNQVWSPRFYRITHELKFDEVEKKNRQFFRLQGLALGLVGGVVIAVFPSTMNALGGNLVAYQSMSTELLLLFSSYVLLSPWWHCQNYYLVYGKGQELMRIVLATSVIGIVTWLILMWLLGPIGIYIGFMTQMLLRSLGIVISARKHWPIKIAWDGVVAGILTTIMGFVCTGAVMA